MFHAYILDDILVAFAYHEIAGFGSPYALHSHVMFVNTSATLFGIFSWGNHFGFSVNMSKSMTVLFKII